MNHTVTDDAEYEQNIKEIRESLDLLRTTYDLYETEGEEKYERVIRMLCGQPQKIH